MSSAKDVLFHHSEQITYPFRRAASKSQNTVQTSSSSKNAGPFCELKKLKLFDLTVKDLQCFSHEDGCFAPQTELKTARLNLRVILCKSFRVYIITFKRPEILQNSHYIRSPKSFSREIRCCLRVRYRI